MIKLLKILNPFIWCVNVFNYFSWTFYESPTRDLPYDFSKDIKYF